MSVAGLQARLVNANKGYRAHFMEELWAAEAQWNPILDALTMEQPSTGPSEDVNFSDGPPTMEEWTDERPMSTLGVKGWNLKNKDYANGVAIDRNDLEDDRLGLYNNSIRSMARMGVLKKVALLRDLINGGFSGSTYWDAVEFFSATHPNSGNANTNLQTGALSAANFKAAVLKLEQMKDPNGEEMALTATHLIIPSGLKYTAKTIVGQEFLASGEKNINLNEVAVLRVPGLTANYWAVADLSWSLKPFIFQNRRGIQFTEVTDATSDAVFHRRKYKYGADWRGRVGYAHYQFMVGSTGP